MVFQIWIASLIMIIHGGFMLSVINCIITMILMLFLLPAGIMDGVFASSALILMLTQYYGNKEIGSN